MPGRAGGGTPARQAVPPLRVAFCIDNMNVGGTELNAVRTAPHLLAAGVELSVFSLSEGGALLERYTRLGVPVDCLPIRSLYGRSALVAGRQMRRLIRQRGIQIVHAHDFYSNIFAGPWTRSAGAAFVASRRWWEGPDRRSQRWANRASYLLAHRILANSPSVAELLVRGERVPRRRVVVVPNFLDAEAFSPPSAAWRADRLTALGVPPGVPVIGVVAKLSRVKDQGTLLCAAAELSPAWPTLHLILVGSDGGCQEELERQASSAALAGRVHFAGEQLGHPSWHHLFDVSVLTSVSEGLPNSVLEAMAAARPVVATAVGAVPDAIADGVTGFLVRPSDPAELAARLRILLADPGLRQSLGRAAQKRALSGFTAEAAIGRLLDAYRAVATRPGQVP